MTLGIYTTGVYSSIYELQIRDDNNDGDNTCNEIALVSGRVDINVSKSRHGKRRSFASVLVLFKSLALVK